MEEKLIIFDKFPNAIDANIVKGALESSGVPAGVICDSTANAMWMAPVAVVVFRRDLENAIRALYGGESNYEDYKDEMDAFAFENWQACNKVFCDLALKIHPEIGGKQYRDLYAQAKEYVIKDKKPTISYIQRRLSVGYNKAAGFMERMEQEGIVSAPDPNGKRHIL